MRTLFCSSKSLRPREQLIRVSSFWLLTRRSTMTKLTRSMATSTPPMICSDPWLHQIKEIRTPRKVGIICINSTLAEWRISISLDRCLSMELGHQVSRIHWWRSYSNVWSVSQMMHRRIRQPFCKNFPNLIRLGALRSGTSGWLELSLSWADKALCLHRSKHLNKPCK